eukprot:3241042-Amphidinium_carterae.1
MDSKVEFLCCCLMQQAFKTSAELQRKGLKRSSCSVAEPMSTLHTTSPLLLRLVLETGCWLSRM